jgi:hypothetical protein
MSKCRPWTTSRQALRSEWFFLNRIDTTFVSRRITCISRPGRRGILVTKISDHSVEDVGFVGVAVITGYEFKNRRLEPWYADLGIGHVARIDDLSHDLSISNSAPRP